MDFSRRRWCTAAVALAAARAVPARAAHDEGGHAVRIGLTAVILDDQAGFLEQWRAYLERKLGQPVRFVQRGTYRGINDLLRESKLEFAWICGAPYVRMRNQLRLVVVPLHEGRPLYRSYVIVPASDAATASLLDLRGRIFAYSDPDSNSGYVYAQYRLLELNQRPSTFFGRTFFTWAHRNVVAAVGAGLAHGGCVDGHVWETLRGQQPAVAARTRVVEQSPEFGYPPIVARADLPAAQFNALQRVLLGMAEDEEGRRLLRRLNLDGFTLAEPALFDDIARMTRALEAA